jgi:hypothetical protein
MSAIEYQMRLESNINRKFFIDVSSARFMSGLLFIFVGYEKGFSVNIVMVVYLKVSFVHAPAPIPES